MITGKSTLRANKFIAVCCTSDGYTLIDRIQGTVLANLIVWNQADDQINTVLKDAVLNAYYEYGQSLKCYD